MSMSQTGYLQGLLTKAPKTGIEYNRLGKSGLKISKVVLGAMSFGHKEWRDWVLEEKEAVFSRSSASYPCRLKRGLLSLPRLGFYLAKRHRPRTGPHS
ncbi:hypothetical protein CC79DRAFT_1328751 [Sarocladium strictum]